MSNNNCMFNCDGKKNVCYPDKNNNIKCEICGLNYEIAIKELKSKNKHRCIVQLFLFLLSIFGSIISICFVYVWYNIKYECKDGYSEKLGCIVDKKTIQEKRLFREKEFERMHQALHGFYNFKDIKDLKDMKDIGDFKEKNNIKDVNNIEDIEKLSRETIDRVNNSVKKLYEKNN